MRFAWVCWNAYRKVGTNGVHFSTIEKNGVPNLLVIVATGRKAWQVAEDVMESAPGQRDKAHSAES